MSLDMAKELMVKIIPDKTNKFIAANSKPLETVGWTLIDLHFGQIKIKQKVVVIKGLSTC